MSKEMERVAKNLRQKLSEKFASKGMFSVRCACKKQCQVVINRRWFEINSTDLNNLKPTKLEGGDIYFTGTPEEIITFIDAFLAKSKTLSAREAKQAA